MKVYIFADQEGCACIFSRQEGYVHAEEYATIELVAVCNALLEHGVEQILLNTIHTVEYHKFPAQVRILHGLERHDIYTCGMEGGFDAAIVVGMHAMAGGRERGCWRHTLLPHPISRAYSAIEEVRLNDRLVGEFELFAAFAGLHRVPVIMESGDYWAGLEAADFIPGIEVVEVKHGTSYESAISLTPQAAADAAADGAVHALRLIGQIPPVRIDGQVTIQVRYLFPERATDAMMAVADCRRIDERTVAVTYPDLRAFREHHGCIRAPELPVYAQDVDMPRATGLFTRLGGEPYESTPTYPPPSR